MPRLALRSKAAINQGAGATGTTIGRANLNGSGANESFITGAQDPAGVAVNGSHIYWSNFGSLAGTGTTIGRANLNGTGVDQHFINAPRNPRGVAVASGS